MHIPVNFSYELLLQLYHSLEVSHYRFADLDEFVNDGDEHNEQKVFIRHDVDRYPERALKMARLESSRSIKTIYFFRYHDMEQFPHCMDQAISLGHRVGYHYENLANHRGNIPLALEEFDEHLNKIRSRWGIKYISMHGSPLSRIHNQDIWHHIKPEDFGLIDVSTFNSSKDFLYLTDTGGTWNSNKYNLRDYLQPFSQNNFKARSTRQLILNILDKKLPNRLMFNIHPQRWNDNYWSCLKEQLIQNLKNPVKYSIKIIRSNSPKA